MYRRQGTEPSSSIDWLPWGLSVFGACCAVFVLVKGVLPERSVNRELVQRVARLESDLSRARQAAVDELARAKEQLQEQTLANQVEVVALREQERLRAARELARRDLAQSLATEIAAEDVLLQERGGDLAIVVRDALLFTGNRSAIESKGKRFLRGLAQSIRRLPAEQVYRIGGRTERQQRSIARFLEVAGRISHAQLVTAGPPPPAPPGSPPPDTVEILMMMRKR